MPARQTALTMQTIPGFLCFTDKKKSASLNDKVGKRWGAERESSSPFHNCMNFKYIVAGAASVRTAGSAARLLILELRGELTVENLFTSDHACRPDGTHSRMHIHTRTHTHTHSLCVTFPLLSALHTRCISEA